MEYSGPFYPTMSFIRSISQIQQELDASKKLKDDKEKEKDKTRGEREFPVVLGSTIAYV